MKKASLFNFVVRRLSFLKRVPLLQLVFDAWLRLWLMITRPEISSYMDEIEARVGAWADVTVGLHKYGGLQFNYYDKEIGHLHGNGLLDIRFSRAVKAQLLADGRVDDHHVFSNSGWISFYIYSADDKHYALSLLNISYQQLKDKKIAA